jgi:hypothetical protein
MIYYAIQIYGPDLECVGGLETLNVSVVARSRSRASTEAFSYCHTRAALCSRSQMLAALAAKRVAATSPEVAVAAAGSMTAVPRAVPRSAARGGGLVRRPSREEAGKGGVAMVRIRVWW